MTTMFVFLSSAKEMKTIFFSSHDVSKPDSGSYLSEVQLYSVDAIPVMSYVICLKNSDMWPVTIRQQYLLLPKISILTGTLL